MARPAGRSLAARLALLLSACASAACHLAPARVWNLEQLHTSEGAPRRRANLKSDLGYLLSSSVLASSFGGADYRAQQSEEKSISDPLEKCLDNVVALAECSRDERVAALQAWAFAWLAVDCTYVLSRERCALELGGLGQALGLAEPPPELGAGPSTPQEVLAAAERLIAVVRQVLAAPGLAGNALTAACDGVRALALDREGTLRMLRASNALLELDEQAAFFEPLRGLRLELARRAVGLALREALEDSNGHVRAAALESSVRAFPAQRGELLRRALLDPVQGVEAPEQVSLRALELLARYGAPPPPAGLESARLESAQLDVVRYEQEWSDLLAQILRAQIGGPHGVAACRAMQKVLGGEATLRPEVWIARWREARATAQPPAAAAPTERGTAP